MQYQEFRKIFEPNGIITHNSFHLKIAEPEKLRPFKRFILREYLQYKSLEKRENNNFTSVARIVSGEENMNVAEVLEIENGLISESMVYHG